MLAARGPASAVWSGWQKLDWVSGRGHPADAVFPQDAETRPLAFSLSALWSTSDAARLVVRHEALLPFPEPLKPRMLVPRQEPTSRPTRLGPVQCFWQRDPWSSDEELLSASQEPLVAASAPALPAPPPCSCPALPIIRRKRRKELARLHDALRPYTQASSREAADDDLALRDAAIAAAGATCKRLHALVNSSAATRAFQEAGCAAPALRKMTRACDRCCPWQD